MFQPEESRNKAIKGESCVGSGRTVNGTSGWKNDTASAELLDRGGPGDGGRNRDSKVCAVL